MDLYTDLKITPWEAALGTKVSINSIDETVSLCIPQGTESGEKVRIPNKGYKDGKGGRGDLVAEVKIMVPKNLNEEEKNYLKNLIRYQDIIQGRHKYIDIIQKRCYNNK